jgi:hypothetical protein
MSDKWDEYWLFLKNGDNRHRFLTFDSQQEAQEMIACLRLLTVGNPAAIAYEVEHRQFHIDDETNPDGVLIDTLRY